MRALRATTGLLTAVMAVTIAYGFAAGSFSDEGGTILDLAWGRVTLIDLYVGLALFGGWIVLRERSWKRRKFGMAIAARMPMIATTIISSISVKPPLRFAGSFIMMVLSLLRIPRASTL